MSRTDIRLTLTTRYGRTGVSILGRAAPMAWDSDGDDEPTVALFELLTQDGAVVESFAIDGNAWRELEDTGNFASFLADAQAGGIELALRAQLDDFENHYEHDRCGAAWTDTHSCACNDRCPACHSEIEPHHSEQLAGLDDEQPAGLIAAGQAQQELLPSAEPTNEARPRA